MPDNQDIGAPLATRAGQTSGEPQTFVVSTRLEQSVVATMRPLIIPLGLGPASFRRSVGGTADA